MTQQLAVVEATPALRRDMSMRALLAAVADGRIALDCRERSIDIGNVWMGPDGVAFAGPWDPTGRRLDFLEFRGIVALIWLGGGSEVTAELTTLGWRRFAQLVRPLTPDEHWRRGDAYPPPGHRLHRPGQDYC